jgi:hypothetical protein
MHQHQPSANKTSQYHILVYGSHKYVLKKNPTGFVWDVTDTAKVALEIEILSYILLLLYG